MRIFEWPSMQAWQCTIHNSIPVYPLSDYVLYRRLFKVTLTVEFLCVDFYVKNIKQQLQKLRFVLLDVHKDTNFKFIVINKQRTSSCLATGSKSFNLTKRDLRPWSGNISRDKVSRFRQLHILQYYIYLCYCNGYH